MDNGEACIVDKRFIDMMDISNVSGIFGRGVHYALVFEFNDGNRTFIMPIRAKDEKQKEDANKIVKALTE